jgi:hypothetical protein
MIGTPPIVGHIRFPVWTHTTERDGNLAWGIRDGPTLSPSANNKGGSFVRHAAAEGGLANNQVQYLYRCLLPLPTSTAIATTGTSPRAVLCTDLYSCAVVCMCSRYDIYFVVGGAECCEARACQRLHVQLRQRSTQLG